MRFCVLGGYDPEYPRNAIIRKGLTANGVDVLPVRTSRKHKFWRRYPALTAALFRTRGRIDWIFVPEFGQKDVPLAFLMGRLRGSRIAFDPLAPRYETKILDRRIHPPGSAAARWNHFIDTWSLRRPDLVLADTVEHREYYLREFGASPDRTEVLPVGFDDEVFEPRPRKHHDGPLTVLFFGSFLPLHGIESIVEAAALVSREDPEVRFVLLGSGEMLPRAREIAALGGSANLSFEGWIGYGELPVRIAEADICLGIFGRGEKARRVIPHKIFQSMAMNRPVVTASTPAVKEQFSHGRDIFLCPEPYPETLAGAVLELKRDPGFRTRLAEAGHRRVWGEFTPKAIGQKLLSLLAARSGDRPN